MSHCFLMGHLRFFRCLKIGTIRAIPGNKGGTWAAQARGLAARHSRLADLEQADAILFLREPFFVSYSDWSACA